jgi:hypothetical protein
MQICHDHNITYEDGIDCPMCTIEGDVGRRWRRFCMTLEEIICHGGVDPTAQDEIIKLLDKTLMVEK